MKSQNFQRTAALLTVVLASAVNANAADWSDTYIGYRYGTSFAEPYEGNSISKNIFNLSGVSGYSYGTNFFNVDMLMSNSNDPSAVGATSGAQETYVVYRNTVDWSKISGASMKMGILRDAGATFGFDYNTKTDAGYNSKKRMLVAGPTLMFDVPGFLNVSVLALQESNAPYNGFSHVSTPRYTYKVHPELDVVWGVPFTLGVPLLFKGYGDIIASKGLDEFGNQTATETHIDMEVMYSITKSFSAGVEYEYWKNKFGNNASGPAGSGAFAKTPMVRVEYHF